MPRYSAALPFLSFPVLLFAALDLCREISASVVLALRGTIKSRTSFLLMKPFYEQPFLRWLSCGLLKAILLSH